MAAAVAPSEDPRGPRASPKVLGPETDLESGSGKGLLSLPRPCRRTRRREAGRRPLRADALPGGCQESPASSRGGLHLFPVLTKLPEYKLPSEPVLC